MASLRISVLFLLLAGNAASAQDMHRCLRADGSVIYTDRLCEPEQTEKPAAATSGPAPPQASRSGRTGLPPPPACAASKMTTSVWLFYANLIGSFISEIRGEVDGNEGNFEDGAHVQELINAVERSLRERRWVNIPLEQPPVAGSAS